MLNTRTLGTVALICAPALFAEILLTPDGSMHQIVGTTSFIFMFGWLCSNLAMQQMQAIGTGLWAKIVLRIQMVGVSLAMLFGFLEATQLVSEDNLLFVISDLSWPISMLFMIAVGIMAIRANRWAGWQRFVPLICALWLPAAMLVGMATGGNPDLEFVNAYFGFTWTAIAWSVLALIVRSNATLVAPKIDSTLEHSEPVVNAG